MMADGGFVGMVLAEKGIVLLITFGMLNRMSIGGELDLLVYF